MTKNDLRNVATEVLSTAGDLGKKAPSPDVLALFRSLADAHRESSITEREIARIEAHRDVYLEDIRQRYGLFRDVFDRVFDERSEAINKAYAVIDRGLDNDDNDVIVKGLQVLGGIVSSSPFANIESLKNAIEQGGTIEI